MIQNVNSSKTFLFFGVFKISDIKKVKDNTMNIHVSNAVKK